MLPLRFQGRTQAFIAFFLACGLLIQPRLWPPAAQAVKTTASADLSGGALAPAALWAKALTPSGRWYAMRRQLGHWRGSLDWALLEGWTREQALVAVLSSAFVVAAVSQSDRARMPAVLRTSAKTAAVVVEKVRAGKRLPKQKAPESAFNGETVDKPALRHRAKKNPGPRTRPAGLRRLGVLAQRFLTQLSRRLPVRLDSLETRLWSGALTLLGAEDWWMPNVMVEASWMVCWGMTLDLLSRWPWRLRERPRVFERRIGYSV